MVLAQVFSPCPAHRSQEALSFTTTGQYMRQSYLACAIQQAFGSHWLNEKPNESRAPMSLSRLKSRIRPDCKILQRSKFCDEALRCHTWICNDLQLFFSMLQGCLCGGERAPRSFLQLPRALSPSFKLFKGIPSVPRVLD